ncbi:hypothetical protein RWH44_03415 [Microbacterium sp. KSW2-29]|uniref:Cell wall protein n=1 Tax=Microbacterium phycohabitans TaxID=3075993 RepID=A0ABU3SIX9_9MICO|nr:hypothetical protein [Microbacterium sp. KSW2-29]MDU0344747.1 hypothetical protein [Microbacterium sp. KSW2-29]
MSTENSETATGSVSRRAVIKTAAWAAPVIAVAVAAPLASASPASANIQALVGGNIVANYSNSTFSGQFQNAGIQLSNVIGSYSTGNLKATYRVTGTNITGQITKEDGSLFTVGETITSGGTVWTVAAVSGTNRRVDFTGQPVTVSGSSGSPAQVSIFAPRAKYAGTFDPAEISEDTPLSAAVSVSATAVNNGVSVTNVSSTP